MRKLKKESEGGKKKVYYLENAIKFCLPFIKMYNTSENQTPSTSPNTPTVSQTTGTPPAQTKDQPVGLTLPAQAKKLFILRNNRPADTDHEYVAKQVLKPKKAKTLADEVASSSNIIDRQQSIKMFLLSLIPELEELSDYQIKLFKRRVFYIIDEVSNTKE